MLVGSHVVPDSVLDTLKKPTHLAIIGMLGVGGGKV